jgi:hypothetical protein
MISVVIKENVLGGEMRCGLCGSRTQTEFGPDLFLEGTMQVLCHECAQDYSPELVQLVEGATASTV